MKYAVVAVLIAVVLAAGCIGQNAPPTGGSVSGTPTDGQILEFYGAECPHCINMVPIVEQVEKETGITVVRLEVWYNETNKAKMTEYKDMITAGCNGSFGVPAFVNLNTGKSVCGELTADELKAFIAG